MSSHTSGGSPLFKAALLTIVALSLFGVGAAYGSLRAEPQPHMREALLSLKTARGHLEAATADKGGHRAKAIDLVVSAIAEVQAGIGYDEHH